MFCDEVKEEIGESNATFEGLDKMRTFEDSTIKMSASFLFMHKNQEKDLFMLLLTTYSFLVITQLLCKSQSYVSHF